MQNVELTWGEIKNDTFIGILQKLINSPLEFHVTLALLNIAKKVNDEVTLANVMGEKLRDKFKAAQTEEEKKVLTEELAKASSHKFEVRVPKFSSTCLKNVRLTVGELLAVRPLLSDADEIASLDVLDAPTPVADAPQMEMNV